MESFVGAIGGLLMMSLIVVLLYRFILDLGVVKSDVGVKRINYFAIAAVVFGLANILIGALMFNFRSGAMTVFDFKSIWEMEPVTTTLNHGKSSPFPLHSLLLNLFSKVLFDMYAECALYISFLSGVVSCVAVGLLFDKLYFWFLCLPGVFFLFLPSSFSMFMALFLVFLVLNKYNKRIPAIIFAVLCCLTHISGIITIVLLVINFVLKDKENIRGYVEAFVIAIVQLAACICMVVMDWGSTAEYWFVYFVPVLMLVDKTECFDNENVSKSVMMITALVSGFYMMGKIYKLF